MYILVQNFNKNIFVCFSQFITVTCSIRGEMRMYTKRRLEVFIGRNQWGIQYRWDIYIFFGIVLCEHGNEHAGSTNVDSFIR